MLLDARFSQASSSPMIRNYLGFPSGVSGAELMRRAWWQAMMFGAVSRIGRTVTSIRREGDSHVLALDDGAEVTAGTVILATGVEYRRIGVPSVDSLVGRGVFYGYGAVDALGMHGVDVAVVGGANSAVQAAAHVARYARSVRLIVRGPSLEHGASEYLIEQVGALPNATVLLNSEVVGARNEHQLSSITVRNRVTGETVEHEAAGLFILIGATPRTDWLPPELARDSRGFVLTGDDGPRLEWPNRPRLPYETTLPGVFAVGDVRSGSVKRVAAAVGEGSAAVQQVLRYRAHLEEIARGDRARTRGEPLAVSG
jgi:thioredoxin reductase (NADPH)